jgi:hypothetical protein
MEPRGCNWWQAVASAAAPNRAETSANRCRGLRRSVRGLCTKALQIGLGWRDFDASRVRDGYILGLRREMSRVPARARVIRSPTTGSESSCNPSVGVARAGAKLTTSFAREGVIGIAATPRFQIAGLSRRRSRVRVPSLPPKKALLIAGLRLLIEYGRRNPSRRKKACR